MKLDRLVRGLLAGLIVLLVLALVAALLFVTEAALNVWDRLAAAPAWVWIGYLAALLGLIGGGFWLIWRLLVPRRRSLASSAVPALSESELRDAVAAATAGGIDALAAQRELDRLAERRAAGELYIAMFGDISTGKSSLIAALLPGADVEISPVGGSTRTVRHYRWTGLLGDQVMVTDVPGTGLELDAIARAEAGRAHVIVYVCDAELTRRQREDLEALAATGKPLVLALNKSDRYGDAERTAILARLREHLAGLPGPAIPVVAIRAGGSEEVRRIGPDGTETAEIRSRPAELEPLVDAVHAVLRTDRATLDSLRDQSVLRIAQRQLDEATAAQRRARAEELVRGYTRKAVIGALAAVSPGTDILIQGYLGTAMVRELCGLYQVPVRDLDVEQFLDLSQSHVGRALPIVLALAGNAAKAFPGVGTLAGGVLHAFAYGFIFDALGRSLAQTLAQRGELAPAVAAQRFRDSLGEDLEGRARRMLGLALEARSELPAPDRKAADD